MTREDDKEARRRHPDSLLRKAKRELLDMLRDEWIVGRHAWRRRGELEKRVR